MELMRQSLVMLLLAATIGVPTLVGWPESGRAGGAQTTAPELRLLALGDSLTAGFGLPAADGFTRQLERALKARGWAVRVIDAGVSGDTTAGGRARLNWALTGADGVRPDAVLVELGANDVLRGLDPAAARANLDAILATVRRQGVPVLLAGMVTPRNLGSDYARRFDPIYAELAALHGTLHYPFFLEGVAGVTSLNQSDGLHPNAAGVAVIVNNILPMVEHLLEQARTHQAPRT